MNSETEDKDSLLVTLQRLVTRNKLSLIFTKTILFPHKTAYFMNNSHNAYKNVDVNSKFNITKFFFEDFFKVSKEQKTISEI